MQTKTQAVTSDAFAFPLPAWCDADQAKQAGDEQPDRSGNRNGDVGARPGPNENTTLEITNDQSRWLAAGSTQFQAYDLS